MKTETLVRQRAARKANKNRKAAKHTKQSSAKFVEQLLSSEDKKVVMRELDSVKVELLYLASRVEDLVDEVEGW